MSKKPEIPKPAEKVDIKQLMDYSDKQVDKAEKTMEKKSQEQSDFSIETSKLETPE